MLCGMNEENSFSESVGYHCILSRGRFFYVSCFSGASTPVRSMVEAANNTFNFVPFVFLNGALGIVMVLGAFITAGEEIAVV